MNKQHSFYIIFFLIVLFCISNISKTIESDVVQDISTAFSNIEKVSAQIELVLAGIKAVNTSMQSTVQNVGSRATNTARLITQLTTSLKNSSVDLKNSFEQPISMYNNAAQKLDRLDMSGLQDMVEATRSIITSVTHKIDYKNITLSLVEISNDLTNIIAAFNNILGVVKINFIDAYMKDSADSKKIGDVLSMINTISTGLNEVTLQLKNKLK